MGLKKICAFICSSAMLFSSAIIPISATENDMRDITTMELVRDMGIGINLGNTYESCGDWIAQWGDGSVESYETAWGSPVITEDMIKGYAEAGFGVLRIPVAWSNLIGDDYTINADYLAKVKQVTDWTINSGMYAIVNIHWDGGWFANFSTDKENCMYKYERIWTQLSEAFKDYDDHLMLESLNEEGCWDDIWNRWGAPTGKDTAFGLLNEINQKFVDIVRSSGGNNAERHLLIAGYATDVELTCDELYKMPDDPANRCAVSVHYYTPASFAILEEDADWAKASSTWGTDADFEELEKYMTMMKENFIDEGVPVIIGEYGCPTKNKEEESVRRFISSVCQTAYDKSICPVLWDIEDLHYDRTTATMIDSVLAESLKNIPEKSETDKPVESLAGDVNSDGVINIIDVVMLKKHLMNVESLPDTKNADCSNNGIIDAMDVVCLKKAVIA